MSPRPEHPRPDFHRDEWLSLNGAWQFVETDDDAASFATAEEFPDTILVPFCRESELSGLGRKGFVRNVWYRRTFARPTEWKASRTRLHIGACDWRTTVWVNGTEVGRHVGGSAPMAFNITDALQPDDNVVVVHAFDDTRSGLQALGKQAMSEHSEGCVYTRTTGIWQSVWLEAVPDTSIAGFQVVPDLAGSRFLLQIEVAGATGDEQVQARLAEDGTEVSRSEAPADFRNARLELAVPNPRPWSPADPHLYDLVLEVVRNGVVVDRVDSYAGLRTVTIRGNQVLLNGERVFQRLVLDQGFYPDGIWTAPSYEALERDIDLSMQAGFNGARLHEKVFEPLFLYLAAKKGYLVWGEFPNWGLNYADTRIDRPMIEEWVEIVRRDRNQPAVIGWCPFNETPAEARPLQQTVVRLTRELDPTRPVLETSGWSHGMPDPEMKDDHDYNQDPISFAERWAKFSLPIPFMVSEYGGIGWNLEGGWGYGNAPATIEEFYDRLAGLSKTLLDNVDMFGYCYTQLTDVEQEKNGVYAYDRSPKFDMARVRAALTGS